MSTLKAALGHWALPLTGLYLLIDGIVGLFAGGGSIPLVLLKLLEVAAGIACLCAS